MGRGQAGERLHSLSLWGGVRQFEYWNVAAGYGLIDERVCKGVSGAVTAIGLFHEWISAHDRKPEHFLLNLEASPNEMGIAVVDHAFAMSTYWIRADDRDWPSPFQLEGVPEDAVAVEMAVRAINACTDATINEIWRKSPWSSCQMKGGTS